MSRQRAVEPSVAGGTLSKAAGLVMEGGCEQLSQTWQPRGDTAVWGTQRWWLWQTDAASPGARQV